MGHNHLGPAHHRIKPGNAIRVICRYFGSVEQIKSGELECEQVKIDGDSTHLRCATGAIDQSKRGEQRRIKFAG